ncbi:SDR family oxidoreductase [Shewanella submarina]|uniref:SDR family NAD(P)-dependent oxidoreductase n=1 Tax=Shewanella submarina TaxID=2016376 RepID=A0ABV7GCK7_9GAMM|nr:SDR family oxidoreductase [Shewanella submarina]MCL1039725.1 SDR family oxidoreductase [Shewanella submarina]
MMKLIGKTALITGASKGIGRAIARLFASEGAVVICCARNQTELDLLISEIESDNGRGVAVVADVTRPEQRRALMEKSVAVSGKIDLLVNNVGGGGPNNALECQSELLEELFAFNVTPAFALTQLCVPYMGDDGAIINISSAAARYIQTQFTAYGTAKAALSHLTRLLAQELAPGIRVNGIEPGPVLTDALLAAAPEQMLDTMCKRTPLKRMGTPEDVAQAALFLASDSSSWITGKMLELDGGAEQTVWPG